MGINEFVVDSGAGISIIKPGVYGNKIRPTATSSGSISHGLYREARCHVRVKWKEL
jgi:hypothetical protein